MTNFSAWGDLRSLRSLPPGYAGRDPQRRGVFSAALQQSEELLRGAEQLGYASRPLNLFYGLSQAGRAITAAGSPPHFSLPGEPDRAWLLKGHGIGVSGSSLDDPLEDILLRNQSPEPLPARSNKPLPAFPGLARVLGSDSLLQPVALVDLWAALPEASERPAPGAGSRWRALSLSWDEQETSAIAAWVGALPDGVVGGSQGSASRFPLCRGSL